MLAVSLVNPCLSSSPFGPKWHPWARWAVAMTSSLGSYRQMDATWLRRRTDFSSSGLRFADHRVRLESLGSGEVQVSRLAPFY